jgi:hypothetical protein
MREAFAHKAALAVNPLADERAPGAAINAALCGYWEHDAPCPLGGDLMGVPATGKVLVRRGMQMFRIETTRLSSVGADSIKWFRYRDGGRRQENYRMSAEMSACDDKAHDLIRGACP